jgi:pimeloyl-ACP methyl ester carboxylesterase
VVAGSVPPHEIANDWPDWYPSAEREEYRRYLTSTPEDLVPEYEHNAGDLALTTAAFDGWDFPEVDIEASERFPAAAEAVAEAIRRSVSTGNWGRVDEGLAWAHAWGVKLGDIRVPVTIRHGTADRNIMVEQGRWLAAQIPRARLQILEGHGHMSVAMPFEPVIDALLASGR